MLYYSYLTCAYGGRARHRQQSGSADVAPCICLFINELPGFAHTSPEMCLHVFSVCAYCLIFLGGGGSEVFPRFPFL